MSSAPEKKKVVPRQQDVSSEVGCDGVLWSLGQLRQPMGEQYDEPTGNDSK